MNNVEVVRLLRLRGRLQAGELLQALGVSRATLMRQVQAAGNAVVARGHARRRTYAARRLLRGSDAALPLYRVDEQGDVDEIARLDLIHPDGCATEFLADFGWPLDEDMQSGWFDGLPYPLQDMRPQGFLGRNFARHYAALLQVPEDPMVWSDDHALHAMSLLGTDLLGNLIVGEPACRQWLARVEGGERTQAEHLVDDLSLPERYEQLAARALAQGVVGSSAGGEFPKFEAVRRQADGKVCHVLVKFGGSDNSPGAQRWSDLLVCEHLASQALATHLNMRVATSRIHRLGARTYLEVERFDRHGVDGRSGVASWASVNGALFGLAGVPWTVAADHLAERAWLSPNDARQTAQLWHFGQLIGNNDMHDGNLSFQPHVVDGQPGLKLAPAYDMLPMLYAPSRGVELQPREFRPRLPLPAERELWAGAAQAAVVFWASAAADARISHRFREVCTDNAELLARML